TRAVRRSRRHPGDPAQGRPGCRARPGRDPRAPAVAGDRGRRAAGAQSRRRAGRSQALPDRMRARAPAHAPAARLRAAGVAVGPDRLRGRRAIRAKPLQLRRMDLRALPYRVPADPGWRWWLAAAVDPAHPSAEETPRDHARIATVAVPTNA